MEVTQQWSLECDEKLRLIQHHEREADRFRKEAEQLQKEAGLLEGRVSKYKKFWLENKDVLGLGAGVGGAGVGGGGRVSDAQFEELRSELACRRELYDQVSTALALASPNPSHYSP